MIVVFCITACSSKKGQADVLGYVTDTSNGLTKKDSAGNVKITCMLVPEQRLEDRGGTDVMRFKILLETEREQTTDSMMYYMNYRSGEMFRLIKGKDTLLPVLSERMANGRKDIHEFTVLFDDGQSIGKNDLWVVADSGAILLQRRTLAFTKRDITKAYKTLFAYEVKD